MKKTFHSPILLSLLTSLLVAFGTLSTQAKIWRVDNNGGSPGDFTTAQTAHDAATVVADDTLYFNGSGTGYGDLTMTKRLYLFGPGYFLAQNPETQASTNSAYIGTLRINPTASGALVTGMTFARVLLFASNTLFKRNYVTWSGNYPVLIGENASFVGAAYYTPSNVIFVQNYVVQTSFGNALRVAPGCSNIIVQNNFLHSAQGVSHGYDAITGQSSITFSQNMVYGTINTTSTALTNNYLYGGSITGSGNSYNNNMCNGTQFPASTNIQSQPIANVCLMTGSDDGYYQLKPNTTTPAYTNPARGAGVGGVDIGMFGGNDPYVLSGMPAIPAIWFFNAPSSGSGASGLQVQIKAKSHN